MSANDYTEYGPRVMVQILIRFTFGNSTSAQLPYDRASGEAFFMQLDSLENLRVVA